MTHHATLVRTSTPLEYRSDTQSQTIYFSFDRIGVDEVKTITAQATLRPTEGDAQVFVLQTLFVTHEAQNALLKLFEEPPMGLRFILVLPPAVQLLPTLLSRVGEELIETNLSTNESWELFLAANYADRFAQIDSWQKTKDLGWLQAMVSGVHSISQSDVPGNVLPVVQVVGQRLATRGAGNKMLLEHLALALPLRK